MGREVKRVPINFDWPMEQRWEGFCNPHYEPCTDCGERGTTSARDRLSDLVSLLMLSSEDVRRGKCHPYFHEAPLYSTQGKVVSDDIAELTIGLAGRELGFGEHDAIDRWSATKKIMIAAGVDPDSWGICSACSGHGMTPECREKHEEWEPTEPPTGDAYQIWETVSEGSPISPPFETPEELARHMAGTKWGADKGTSYESWLSFINGSGWAPSMVMALPTVLKLQLVH